MATAEFGFETTTLDMEGNVTKTAPYNAITVSAIQEVLPAFQGKIMQVPPIFSALKKDGKKLYEVAREGGTEADLQIEAREVEVYRLALVHPESIQLPRFDIEIECGGGTFVRSLIRDIAHKLGTVATTAGLKRTKQGQFSLEDCLSKEDWSADNIFAEVERHNRLRADEKDETE